jgi:hypothetical protein
LKLEIRNLSLIPWFRHGTNIDRFEAEPRWMELEASGKVLWRNEMALVKKPIELDQDQVNRIKAALKVKSEKEAINAVLKQFDTDFQLAEATLKDAGSFDFKEI